MKNIHVLPTDKPSKILFDMEENYYLPIQEEDVRMDYQDLVQNRHIYIISDEDIKEGDWYITILNNEIFKAGSDTIRFMNDANKSSDTTYKNTHFKIILTTDDQLIKDGVQSIDDEFLEWFVKNPSCEKVEVEVDKYRDTSISDTEVFIDYKIIIPQEEPKQETLEEAINNFKKTDVYINEIKQKQERMYSEEEVLEIIRQYAFEEHLITSSKPDIWFEQFKNK